MNQKQSLGLSVVDHTRFRYIAGSNGMVKLYICVYMHVPQASQISHFPSSVSGLDAQRLVAAKERKS